MIQTTTDKLSNILQQSSRYKSNPAMLNFISYFEATEYPKALYKKEPTRYTKVPCTYLYNSKLSDLFFKHPSYRHENEIRLCVVDRNSEEPYTLNKNPGIILKIDSDFIESITFAPNATEWFKDTVLDVVQKFDVEPDIYSSELDWHKHIFSPSEIMF
ncbi:hypothetical protein M3P05_20550 [Sansalvadorimonas sp. 2012CJ34-2]|uniref:Uncharacterized protein n=2 Tax=Parendozoicomonas callyspongiae TaxID=2942213 RepID=A0ABT0PLQ4_9GAMM|nr:hypothetical protein [Sansalvadorimonas sp. 2012CJ34-2]